MFREFVGGGNYVNIKVHYTRKFCILFFLKKAVRNITLGINQTWKVYFMVVQQQISMQNLCMNRTTVSAYRCKHSNNKYMLVIAKLIWYHLEWSFLSCKYTNVIVKYLEVTQRLVTQFDTVWIKGSATTYNQESLLLLPGQHDIV